MQQSIFSLHTVNRHFLLPPFLSGARSSWASLRISRTILGCSTRTPSSVVEREIPASLTTWMPLPATTTLASVSSRSSVQSGWGSSFALPRHFLNTICHSKRYFSNQKGFKSARMTWNQPLSWPYGVISDIQLEVSRSCVQPLSRLLILLVRSKSPSPFGGQPTVWVIKNCGFGEVLWRMLKIYSKMLPKFRKVRWIWLPSDGRNCLEEIDLGQENTSALPLFMSMSSESMCIHWHPLLERSSNWNPFVLRELQV